MRALCRLAAAGAVPVLVAVTAPAGWAQTFLPVDPQRDCYTVRSCNFSRTGAVRGCLSSYSCRYCRTVPAACRIGPRGDRVCHEVRCGWAGT